MEFLSEFQQFEMVERVDHRNSQISRLSQVRWKGGRWVGLDVDRIFYLLLKTTAVFGTF